MRRLGLLGGTFDPFHNGHLDVAYAAERALRLDEVIVIVSNIPPHRPQPLASSHHRFAMVSLAIAGRSGWKASDIELAGGGTSFTTDTLRRFHDWGYDATELFFILGADAFAEIETWKDYPAILDRSHFVVVSRPSFPSAAVTTRLPGLATRVRFDLEDVTRPGEPAIFLIDARTADVSATAIRRQLAAGGSAEGLVPESVRQHIEQHGLYGLTPSGRGDVVAAPHSAAGRLHGQDR
jgi:nicotinate-nucleotide adenylyltransferase